MSLDTAIIGSIIGVFQQILFVLAGLLLAKLDVLDFMYGELKFALANYYLFVPLFCIIEISKASNISQISALGLIFFSNVLNCALVIFLSFIYTKIADVDIRIRNCFIIISGLGNVAFFPAVLIYSLCGEGGIFEKDTEYCQYGYGYSMFGLFPLNILIWGIGPFAIQRDKRISLNIMRQMMVIKKFYATVKEFMEENNNFEKANAESLQNIEFDIDNFEHNENLIKYSLEIQMSSKNFDKFSSKYDLFLSKLGPNLMKEIHQKLPKHIMRTKIRAPDLIKKIFNPPVLSCIFGIILGLITVIREWLKTQFAQQLFMKTLVSIGNIALPLSIMLLGSKLSTGFKFGKTVNLRLKDLIAIIIIKFIITPLCGLGFIAICREIGIKQMIKNNVLSFVIFAGWLAPPSTIAISLFVMWNYFVKEIALIQFWTNIVGIVSTIVFLLIYFSIFS